MSSCLEPSTGLPPAPQRLGCCGKVVEALETREGMDGQKTYRLMGVGLAVSEA